METCRSYAPTRRVTTRRRTIKGLFHRDHYYTKLTFASLAAPKCAAFRQPTTVALGVGYNELLGERTARKRRLRKHCCFDAWPAGFRWAGKIMASTTRLDSLFSEGTEKRRATECSGEEWSAWSAGQNNLKLRCFA